jgi:hypothetical protein
MTKFLDLRKKTVPQVKIIYKTVVQQRSWYLELTKVLAAIVVVGTVVWGISRADDAINNKVVKIKPFSAIGLVSATTDSTISIDDAHGSDNASTTSYTFDTSTVTKIETKKYSPITFSDIQVGDRVIVQGTVKGDLVTASRIIDFTSSSSTATTTATTTLPLATTTPEVSTSTDETSSSTSTSTPSLNEVIQNIVDVITGTTTGTSSDTTTVATTTEEVSATTTEDIIPTTTPEVEPPVVEPVTDTATSTESTE